MVLAHELLGVLGAAQQIEERPGLGDQDGGDPLRERTRTLRGGRRLGQGARVQLAHQGAKELLLVGEVQIERGARDAGFPRHPVERGAAVAVAGEAALSRLEDGLAGGITAGGGGAVGASGHPERT